MKLKIDTTKESKSPELMAGRNIRQKNDPLQKVAISRLYAATKNPKPVILNQIKQLRTILTIDPNRYRQLKVNLPYVVCGNFHPPYRRNEYFGSINHFILDIDHLADKEADVQSLKKKLQSDERVELLFLSPSNGGLKVFFQLQQKCFDAAQFSLFYQTFTKRFSEQYQLSQVIDTATSDVTRACFVSWDPEAYFNPSSKCITMADYIDFDDHKAVRKIQKAKNLSKKDGRQKLNLKEPLTDELWKTIKSKLGPGKRQKPDKIIHVPGALEPIVPSITQGVEKYGIKVRDIINIHYGKKFVFSFGNGCWAEINVFYGKKGFTVVKSPKRGRDPRLEGIVYELLCEIFYDSSALNITIKKGQNASDSPK